MEVKLQKLLIATSNKGKLKEFKQLFSDFNIEILSLDDMAEKFEVKEDKETFLENAIKKAKEYANFYKIPVIAEDAGLEIDTLNGYPGVYSARFYSLEFGGKIQNPENKDKANIEKVLNLLEGKENRKARFKSVVVFYVPDDFGLWTEGVCEGKIAEKPAGEGGFGYDPIFIPEGYNVTMAQLQPQEKNKISHRGKAVYKLKNLLSRILSAQ
jgi:XTP/dITP diphosphohydrolase